MEILFKEEYSGYVIFAWWYLPSETWSSAYLGIPDNNCLASSLIHTLQIRGCLGVNSKIAENAKIVPGVYLYLLGWPSLPNPRHLVDNQTVFDQVKQILCDY